MGYTHTHKWEEADREFFLLLWTVVSLVKDKEISKRKGGKG